MANVNTLLEIYTKEFLPYRDRQWQGWRSSYLQFVELVQNTPHREWMTPSFQEFLWERDDVASAGLGKSVVISGAFKDKDLAQALWDVRQIGLAAETKERAEQLGSAFERIMAKVSPRHNPRRPSAKLVRMFMALFPHDVLCLLDRVRNGAVRRYLKLPRQGEDVFIRQQVRMRARLRELLGPEPDYATAVDHSIFTWFLLEKMESVDGEPITVSMPDTPELKEASNDDGGAEGKPSALTPPQSILRLWTPDRQYRGIPHVSDALALHMTVVRLAENGISQAEMITAIQAEVPRLSANTLRAQLSIAKNVLGVIELRDGALRQTELGKKLLDADRPSDELTPVLLRKVYGFAQLLLWLVRSTEGIAISLKDAKDYLEQLSPSWEKSRMSSDIIAWCQELQLVERRARGARSFELQLSEDGLMWAGRVPPGVISASPARLVQKEEELELSTSPSEAKDKTSELKKVAFDQLRDTLKRDPELRHLVFPESLLALFHGALHALPHKRLVLLSGLSGTGKTSLARAYARAYCAALDLAWRRHYELVAVRPDWTDPTGLLGYFNPLGEPPTFLVTSALRFLLEANANPTLPYFLCLDEMNLARVEHYLAPFLSAMEGGSGELSLHGENEAVDGIPPKIPWPRNLFIIGTVNLDETTHSFSDKVLDRGFVFELWDVELETWQARAAERGVGAELLAKVMPVLKKMNEALRPVRRHFGYRTCDEVVAFVAAVGGAVSMEQALDAAVLAKVLPKIRGDGSDELHKALSRLSAICEEAALADSARKIKQMSDVLTSLGIVKFFA